MHGEGGQKLWVREQALTGTEAASRGCRASLVHKPLMRDAPMLDVKGGHVSIGVSSVSAIGGALVMDFLVSGEDSLLHGPSAVTS